MENKVVGYLIIAISVVMGLMIWIFNRALTDIVNTQCEHGSTCPMWGTIDFHTNVSIALMVLVLLVGAYLIFFAKEGKEETKKISKESYKKILALLNSEEKKVFEAVIASEGSIFQSELVEKTGFDKVKVTRILDKLEGRQIIERKRRGMTNVVILKHS